MFHQLAKIKLGTFTRATFTNTKSQNAGPGIGRLAASRASPSVVHAGQLALAEVSLAIHRSSHHWLRSNNMEEPLYRARERALINHQQRVRVRRASTEPPLPPNSNDYAISPRPAAASRSIHLLDRSIVSYPTDRRRQVTSIYLSLLQCENGWPRGVMEWKLWNVGGGCVGARARPGRAYVVVVSCREPARAVPSQTSMHGVTNVYFGVKVIAFYTESQSKLTIP
jgi:hypothetical protein